MVNILGGDIWRKGRTLGLSLMTLLTVLWTSCDNKKSSKEDTIENIYSILNSDTVNSDKKELYLQDYLARNWENLIEEQRYPLEEKLKNIKYARKSYEDLENNMGKNFFIIEVAWCPGDCMYYYFSEEEMKKDLEMIKNDIEKYKKELEKYKKGKNPWFREYTWVVSIKNIKKTTLDKNLLKKIILEKATNPMMSSMEERKFYHKKSEELWINLDEASATIRDPNGGKVELK